MKIDIELRDTDRGKKFVVVYREGETSYFLRVGDLNFEFIWTIDIYNRNVIVTHAKSKMKDCLSQYHQKVQEAMP